MPIIGTGYADNWYMPIIGNLRYMLGKCFIRVSNLHKSWHHLSHDLNNLKELEIIELVTHMSALKLITDTL